MCGIASRRVGGCRWLDPATSGHTIGQKVATPRTGFKVQPPSADHHSKLLILEGSRTWFRGTGRNPTRGVTSATQSDEQVRPTRCSRSTLGPRVHQAAAQVVLTNVTFCIAACEAPLWLQCWLAAPANDGG